MTNRALLAWVIFIVEVYSIAAVELCRLAFG